MTAKTIHLPPETWRTLKQASLDHGKTMRELVAEAVREWLERNGK